MEPIPRKQGDRMKCSPDEFRRAWENYKNNRGKTRTLAGIYLMAELAEKQEPGCASEFMDVWKNRSV